MRQLYNVVRVSLSQSVKLVCGRGACPAGGRRVTYYLVFVVYFYYMPQRSYEIYFIYLVIHNRRAKKPLTLSVKAPKAKSTCHMKSFFFQNNYGKPEPIRTKFYTETYSVRWHSHTQTFGALH